MWMSLIVMHMSAQAETGFILWTSLIRMCLPESVIPKCPRKPAFAVPRYVRIIDELPKTPSEKVRKIELREHGVDADTADRGPQPRRRKR